MSDSRTDQTASDTAPVDALVLPSYRLTLTLGNGVDVVTMTQQRDKLADEVARAIDQYYRPRLFRRRTTIMTLQGTPPVVIPIEKVLCYRFDEE